jgi:outer membrane protein assembly factor BamD (BamD/ComL family)
VSKAVARVTLLLAAMWLAWAAVAHAAPNTVRGVTVRQAQIYINPDPAAAKLAEIDRGREVAVLETSRNWVHVFANLGPEHDVTGWMLDKGVIRSSTPNGDAILYGAAADSEAEASRAHGRRNAAQDAMNLYARMAEYFPQSPRAAEALYRAADIRWQLDKLDLAGRPSAKEKDPHLREPLEEHYMKEVIKKYPHTKWADLAAFHLIDNKLCGEWQGTHDCPEKESEIYLKYAREHPDSPATPEALYDAAMRLADLIEIYKTEEQPAKSQDAASRATRVCQELASRFPQSDWGARGQALLYMVQQNIPVFGNVVE